MGNKDCLTELLNVAIYDDLLLLLASHSPLHIFVVIPYSSYPLSDRLSSVLSFLLDNQTLLDTHKTMLISIFGYFKIFLSFA